MSLFKDVQARRNEGKVDLMEAETIRCNFCNDPAHPQTGCVYGPNTIACRACTVRFWAWVKDHTNKKARRASKAVPTARTFYESIIFKAS